MHKGFEKRKSRLSGITLAVDFDVMNDDALRKKMFKTGTEAAMLKFVRSITQEPST